MSSITTSSSSASLPVSSQRQMGLGNEGRDETASKARSASLHKFQEGKPPAKYTERQYTAGAITGFGLGMLSAGAAAFSLWIIFQQSQRECSDGWAIMYSSAVLITVLKLVDTARGYRSNPY
jgi:hypothetical protein